MKSLDSATRVHLHERIRARCRHVGAREFDPGIDREHEICIFAVHVPLVVLHHPHLLLGQHVCNLVVVPFGNSEQVGVGGPHDLRRTGHVALSGDHHSALFWRVDNERLIAVIPEMDRFEHQRHSFFDVPAVYCRVHFLVERVFRNI